MKVAQVSYYDIKGGAARAAYRVHHALRQNGTDSHMYVNQASAGDWTVHSRESKWDKMIGRLLGNDGDPLDGLIRSVLKTGNPILHSPAILPSGWSRRLNQLDADLLHLHWVNGEMLSLSGIGKLQKPVVWTLHDMWAFCGAEHYTEEFRWREGYRKGNRPSYEGGFDLNRWTWERKRKHWQRPMHIVTPSHWLAQCVRDSALMRDWPVSVIPNPIDTEHWQPLEKALARELLDLPKDVPLLLFGAIGGGQDPRKGFDLLRAALQHLCGEIPELQLVVFGQLRPKDPPDLGFPIHYTGHLHDDLSLRALYSAADVMAVPSRQEAFGQTASEAHACGTPVVAFDTGGLPDIVEHQRTGYLAKSFDTVDLAQGLSWVLSDREQHATLGLAARERALGLWSYDRVAGQYQVVLQQAIEAQSNV